MYMTAGIGELAGKHQTNTMDSSVIVPVMGSIFELKLFMQLPLSSGCPMLVDDWFQGLLSMTIDGQM